MNFVYFKNITNLASPFFQRVFYMKRILSASILMAFGIALCVTAFAEIPAGYYSSLDGKSGEALKTQLHDIIRPHTVLTYSSLWKYFPSTDVYPELVNGKHRVWDMYSSNFYYYPDETYGMNREHSFPKSWWGGTQVEAYTDINHLYPADGDANLAKSYYPLGEVQQSTFDNGVTKVGYAKSGEGGGSSYVFEPADEYKGDFARTYFYMTTCYQDYTWKYTFMVTNSSYLTLIPWAYNMLLTWSRNDPVSQKEIDRNEAVYGIQNNRNPFIDHPELAEYIWGNKAGSVYYIGDQPTGDPVLTSPEAGSSLNFGDVGLGKTLAIDLYVKGENLTGNLTVTLYKDDYAMFSSAVSSIPAASVNATDGYKLRLLYNPTAIGSHTAHLLLSDGGLTGSVGITLNARCLPVPSLAAVKALPADNISSTGYRANWEASTDSVDYYVVTRTAYSSSAADPEEYTTDDNFYQFDDVPDGSTQTYFVQSSRLGYRSEASNVVTVTTSGISPVPTDRALSIASYEGGVVRFICNEEHTGCRFFDLSGRLMFTIPSVAPGAVLTLPLGAYVVTTDQLHRPLRLFVK
jgi:endonuclease I